MIKSGAKAPSPSKKLESTKAASRYMSNFLEYL